MKLLRAALLTIAVALTPLAAHAQSWPAAQPIKVIVPFSAGSATDIIARLVMEQVGSQIGQTYRGRQQGRAPAAPSARMRSRKPIPTATRC